LLARVDLHMVVPPTVIAVVFVGTLALCLTASMVSFRKVASLDPALVFRG
jgi:putative ABC transport system permease protein